MYKGGIIIKKIKNVLFAIFLIFLLVGCGGQKNEIEKNWNTTEGFSQVHVYMGVGNILTMTWSSNEGMAFFQNLVAEEVDEYIKIYVDDNTYYEVQVTGAIVGMSRGFKKNDESLRIIISLSGTSMSLKVNTY